VGNNPLNVVDPGGLDWWDITIMEMYQELNDFGGRGGSNNDWIPIVIQPCSGPPDDRTCDPGNAYIIWVWVPPMQHGGYLGGPNVGGDGQSDDRNKKVQDCMARKKTEADKARSQFQKNVDKRVLRRMARGAVIGGVRGAIFGAGAGAAELGVGAVPGAIFGATVGSISGAGGAAISTIFLEPLAQFRYDYFTYQPALDRAAIGCAAEVNAAPPAPPK
jgi:hypothetical protein